MSDPVKKHRSWVEAFSEWKLEDNPDAMIEHLQGRLKELHEQYWDVRRENISLWHENILLREGDVPDSSSWVLRKIDEQRKEIVRLRQRLGYKDKRDE